MATYNGEKYVLNQIISILDQLSGSDEIIISDDGSTDNTYSIIDRIGDSRIQLFVNYGRKGPVGNFENALSKASGEYIFLADQDDIWLPNKVNVVKSLLKNVDLVLTDCNVVDQNGSVLWPSFFKHRGSTPGFWRNTIKNSYVGCCMAFRRDVLSYVLPFPRNIHMHDWWIGLLVEVKGSTTFYSEPMIKYVRHGNNASPTGGTGYGPVRQLINRLVLLVNILPRLFTTINKY